jgi:RHS repeat-associated protein
MMSRRFTGLGTAAVLTATLLSARPAEAQSASPLVIQPSGTNQVQLFWPATTNFNVLQEIPGFGGTNLWQDVPGAPAVLGTRYSLWLEATNSAAFYRLANRWTAGPSTLPDPASVAPAPQPNVYNDLASLTAFLYTGSNAVQLGVAPGTIKSVQASVLRGRVLQRDSTPLPGVLVSLLGHPEYGYTYTRTNGMFDLAVNGASYTVDFQAIGYCPAQRQMQVPAQDYGTVPDVVLVPLDPVATPVQFGSNAPAQVAMSSPQTDAAGTRSATVFFPAGTAATMVMPDGSSQPVGNLTIRLTEFTVGTNGPAAMPAALPPNSAYTYCAAFSGDEALDAGAAAVQFSQPVPVYVDNFLGIPVGTLVPVGYYDRVQGVWLPSSNGIVMAVLGSTNGVALIDLHGTGQPETAATLAANGFTAEELQTLATLYPIAGKTLWRSPVTRDEPIDFNYGKGTPNVNGNTQGDKPKCSPCDSSPERYGTINFSAQTLSEQIPLVGVPFALNYNSARVPDYRVDDQITVPVAWQPPPNPCANLPAGDVCAIGANYFNPPIGINVQTDIAGEQSAQVYPGTNQVVTVSWDGRDVYGRLVGGSQLASVLIAYLFQPWDYFGVCCGPESQAQFPALFGNDGNSVSFEGHIGTTQAVGAIFQRLLTYPDHRKLGLGGWSPNPLHRLDPTAGILYYGDGRIRKVPQVLLEDSFLTSLASMSYVAAATPDGTVYFHGQIGDDSYIFRRNPGGGYELVTASRQTPGVVQAVFGWSNIDGVPTALVNIGSVVTGLSAGPDGSLYASEGNVIARLTPDGIWHVLMGLDADPQSDHILQPDGTAATESFMTWGTGANPIAVGPDSSVYFACWWPYYAPNANGTNYTMVRKIAPDGRLYTVFGGGGVASTNLSPNWMSLFGTSAYSAHYANNGGGAQGLAVGNDGTVYVSETDGGGSGIFQISPGGVILPFLNGGPTCGEGLYDPNPADPGVTAQIQGDQGEQATNLTYRGAAPTSLVVAQDGSVYLDSENLMVWRVNPNGIVERLAGRYTQSLLPPVDLPLDGGDPLNTSIYPVTALALTSDGSLFLVSSSFSNPGMMPIYIVPGRSSMHGALTAISNQDIPSEDGAEVYVFDATGLHLETLDSLTGATKWAFGYDTNSLVVSILDIAGQQTQIERDASGQATAIIGPYGQRTSLAMDANGFLSAATNPANETTSLSNSAGGLLLAITGLRGETYRVAYDNLGRATTVVDPLGGGWSGLTSDKGVLPDSSYEVDVNWTNSLGDTLSRQMLLQPDGDTSVAAGFDGYPTGTATTRLSGDSSSSLADGSVLYLGVGADPRFGNQVQQVTRTTFSLPNGLVYDASAQQTAGLTDRADPISTLTGLTNVTTINGESDTWVYNPTNRALTLTSPAGRTATLVGDTLGRIVHATAPGEPAAHIAFDSLGRVMALTNTSSAGVALSRFGYDALGQLVTATDPLGRTNAFGYDAAGRLSRQVLSDGALAAFTQDSEDNLTSVTPPGRPAHTFQYSPVGLLTQYTPPLVGADESVSFQYDTERHLTQIDLPDGQALVVMRGLGGRIDSLTLGAGPTLAYQYSTNTGADILLPTTVSSTSGDLLQLGYLGPVLTNTSWSGSITGEVSMQLNSDLLPASQSVDGSAVALTYDPDRLLIQAGSLSITRDPVTGFITATTVGSASDVRAFDDRGLLTNYLASANGTSIWSMTLRYDLIGRITNKVETIGGVTTDFGYAYDVAGRLAGVWQNGLLAASYTYDTNGNRLTRNSETALYDLQDRLQTYDGSVFDWSPNGYLLAWTAGGQTTTYSYDVRGALTAVVPSVGQRIDYVVDAARRRVGKKVGGALQRGWLWDGAQVAAELDGSSAVSLRFIYGADNQTASYLIKATNSYRVFSDERGSVRLVVNAADGSIAQQLDYDEFGRVLTDSAPGFQPFGFAGGIYDPDTGLVRFGARDYDAQTGRWTARDPAGFPGGEALTDSAPGFQPFGTAGGSYDPATGLVHFRALDYDAQTGRWAARAPPGFAGGDFALYNYVNNDPVNQIDTLGTGPFKNPSNPQPPNTHIGPNRPVFYYSNGPFRLTLPGRFYRTNPYPGQLRPDIRDLPESLMPDSGRIRRGGMPTDPGGGTLLTSAWYTRGPRFTGCDE